jgi:hypothetical protein
LQGPKGRKFKRRRSKSAKLVAEEDAIPSATVGMIYTAQVEYRRSMKSTAAY